MIKILVAEDQLLIQQDICKKIEKTGKEVEIVGTAINGKEALEKTIALAPHILITDIKMPLESGLALIRHLKEKNIPVKTVILSGYRDFEYAKEAIQLGVDEYLLKPVSVDDLRYVLDTLETKILSDQENNIQNALYSQLTLGKSISSFTLDSLHYSSCSLMLINIGSCVTFSFQDWMPYDNELDEVLHSSIIEKQLKPNDCFFICDGNTYNQKIIIFLTTRTNCSWLHNIASALQQEINTWGITSTLCISKSLSSLNDLSSEYKLMQTHLSNHLVFAASSILYSKDFLAGLTPPDTDTNSSVTHAFQFAIRTHNLKDFLKVLDQFLEQCKANCVTQSALNSSLKHLLHVCFNQKDHMRMTGPELEIDEYLSNSTSYEELGLSLHLLFTKLFQKRILNVESASHPELLVNQVKDYIRNNYSQDININDIAVHFSVTAAYLSRLFKKYSDTRPIEYLTNYRIKQACLYFSNSQLSVKEIAELCGYSNQFYFSKAFKQITSMSPSEYRIKHQCTI